MSVETATLTVGAHVEANAFHALVPGQAGPFVRNAAADATHFFV